jgi:hypothetical protein
LSQIRKTRWEGIIRGLFGQDVAVIGDIAGLEVVAG